MVRITHSFISLLFIFSLLFFAKDARSEEKTQRWFCPRSVRCDEAGSGCSSQGTSVHRAQITSRSSDESWRRPLANSVSYILECVDTTQGQKCTTGNAETDDFLFKNKNLELLKNLVGYSFEGMYKADGEAVSTNPVETKKGLLDPIEWQSSSAQELSRKFMGVNLIDVRSVTPCDSGSTQKECTFTMKEASGVCASIRWDPYGRVFDSQSLEPISGVTVTLFKKSQTGFYEEYVDPLGVVNNPIVTKETGDFSFVVPDGYYRLTANYNNFKFPFDGLTISSNYTKAYSDLYYSSLSTLFKKQDIIQSGKIVHVDIPLDSLGVPYTAPVKLVGYSEQINKKTKTDELIIEGRVSHPLTKIKAYTKNGTFLNSTQAGKLGEFEIAINQTKITPPDTCCRITLEKVNLNNISTNNNRSFFKKIVSLLKDFEVIAQDKEVSFDIEAIPSFVEGYAYDKNGKIMSEATVGVYLNFSNKPYYQTKADKTGYFRIVSANLPSMPYSFRFSNSAGFITKKTTSQFIKENTVYLNENKLNLYTNKGELLPTRSPSVGLTLAPTTINPTVFSPTGGSINQITNKPIIPTSGQKEPPRWDASIYLIASILLALFGVVGGLLAFYVLQKKTSNNL